jgi:hypothetical protein
MVLMNGSKKARNSASIIARTNTEGGVKKAGIVTTGGHPANVLWRLNRNTPAPNYFPKPRYGSTVKGRVGAVAPFFSS